MVLLRDDAQMKARFGPLGDSANLHVDWCTVCAELTIGSKIILDARDETPSHVESHFDPFVHGVSVGAKLVRGLRQTYHRLRNRFGRTRWNS